MGLSPFTPWIRLLHSEMFGSGSTGSETMFWPWMTSACLLAVMRSAVTVDASTVCRGGSIEGMTVGVQFWPAPPLALFGTFVEHMIEHRPGSRLVATCA